MSCNIRATKKKKNTNKKLNSELQMSALMKEITPRFPAEEKLIVDRFRQDPKLFLPNPRPEQEAQLQQPTEQLEN